MSPSGGRRLRRGGGGTLSTACVRSPQARGSTDPIRRPPLVGGRPLLLAFDAGPLQFVSARLLLRQQQWSCAQRLYPPPAWVAFPLPSQRCRGWSWRALAPGSLLFSRVFPVTLRYPTVGLPPQLPIGPFLVAGACCAGPHHLDHAVQIRPRCGT